VLSLFVVEPFSPNRIGEVRERERVPFSCWGGDASQTGHAYKNNVSVLIKIKNT
jgi:hypothetical protein